VLQICHGACVLKSAAYSRGGMILFHRLTQKAGWECLLFQARSIPEGSIFSTLYDLREENWFGMSVEEVFFNVSGSLHESRSDKNHNPISLV